MPETEARPGLFGSRPVVTITALVLLALGVGSTATALFVPLGHATTDDPQARGDTLYTVWGYANIQTRTAWYSEFAAKDILNFDGIALVAVAGLALSAGTLIALRRRREGAICALVATLTLVAVVGLYYTGLRDYAARTALGLAYTWGTWVLLAGLPVLFLATVWSFWAATPLPPPVRVRGQKPSFHIPARGIRRRDPKPMRILPDYEPKPRVEAEHELSGDGQVEENKNWTTRLKSGVVKPGKFRF